MTLLLVSLLAGVLSVLAPCIVGILPLLVGYGAGEKNIGKAVRVVTGLSLSILLFTLVLKASTSLISIPQQTWQLISGGIVVLFGLSMAFPHAWEAIALKLKLQQLSAKGQQKAAEANGAASDFILGASLGPIFSSCSPTYALIVATILPVSFVRGFVYLLVFIAGLSGTILLITVFGRQLVAKLGWSINPNGIFKRTLGVLFIVLGISFATGLDKAVLTHVVQNGWFDWQVSLESNLQP